MKQNKRRLIEVRNSFKEKYELARKMKDKYYMEFFAKQILEINEMLKERK